MTRSRLCSLGYILPSEAKKMKEDKAEISIEDLVETERAALGPNTTKVTLETFMEWKKKKVCISCPSYPTTFIQLLSSIRTDRGEASCF